MPKHKTCRVCGRALKGINRNRRCLSCMMNKVIAVNKQLRAKKGKYYNKWKENLLNAVK